MEKEKVTNFHGSCLTISLWVPHQSYI
jgi:hypothetical protein